MNLSSLSPILKATVGLAVGVAFAGAVAWGVSRGNHSADTPKFIAGTIGDLTTATPVVEKLPTFPVPAPIVNSTPVFAKASSTPGLKAAADSCPKDSQFLDNPLFKYTLCLPQGWSLIDFGAPNPVSPANASSLLTMRRGEILIGSPDAFPYPIAQTITSGDFSRFEEAIRISISLLQQGIAFGGCTPKPMGAIGGLDALACDDSFSLVPGGGVTYSSSGDLRERKVLIPWVNSLPANILTQNLQRSGFFLFVKVDTSADRFARDGALIDQVVGAIRGYQ